MNPYKMCYNTAQDKHFLLGFPPVHLTAQPSKRYLHSVGVHAIVKDASRHTHTDNLRSFTVVSVPGAAGYSVFGCSQGRS